jgi:hypothetical protein
MGSSKRQANKAIIVSRPYLSDILHLRNSVLVLRKPDRVGDGKWWPDLAQLKQ